MGFKSYMQNRGEAIKRNLPTKDQLRSAGKGFAGALKQLKAEREARNKGVTLPKQSFTDKLNNSGAGLFGKRNIERAKAQSNKPVQLGRLPMQSNPFKR